jgi:hypothetical protein
MCHHELDVTGRGELGFAGLAEGAFNFLSDFGFRLVSAEATIVRYSSERVFVNVYHGRSSYELGIEVGLVGSETERGYPLEAFVRLSDPERASRLRNFMATTTDEVRVGLQRLAEQVKQDVEPALRGSEEVFAELHRQRQEWSKSYASEVLASQVRPKAEAAFRERDYVRFVELLSKIEDALTPAEAQKLSYARRQISE